MVNKLRVEAGECTSAPLPEPSASAECPPVQPEGHTAATVRDTQVCTLSCRDHRHAAMRAPEVRGWTGDSPNVAQVIYVEVVWHGEATNVLFAGEFSNWEGLSMTRYWQRKNHYCSNMLMQSRGEQVEDQTAVEVRRAQLQVHCGWEMGDFR